MYILDPLESNSFGYALSIPVHCPPHGDIEANGVVKNFFLQGSKHVTLLPSRFKRDSTSVITRSVLTTIELCHRISDYTAAFSSGSRSDRPRYHIKHYRLFYLVRHNSNPDRLLTFNPRRASVYSCDPCMRKIKIKRSKVSLFKRYNRNKLTTDGHDRLQYMPLPSLFTRSAVKNLTGHCGRSWSLDPWNSPSR